MYSEHAAALPFGQFVPSVTIGAEKPLPSWTDEVVTPEQFFFSALDSVASWTGERRLLLAILEEAATTFIRYKDATTTRGKRLFREVREWFWSSECNYVCSFASICDHLHIDPEYVRAGLASLQRVNARQAKPAAVPEANLLRRTSI